MELPLVSVSIITYNHNKFIRQALDSVLAQAVDFRYEIIVGDDFSKDGTQDILREYQEKHPDKIQLILHPRDYDCVPGRVNNITNLYACRGKYVAMLDGDDSWISTDKLQKQVDFLEKNKEYALVFSDTIFKYQDGKEVKFSETQTHLSNGNLDFTQKDIIQKGFIQTSSILFRNHLIGEFPDWFWKVYHADYAIQLLASRYGRIRYFPEIFSLRNFYQESFSAPQTQTLEKRKLFYDQYKLFEMEFPDYLKYRYFTVGKGYFNLAFDSFGTMKFFTYISTSVKYTLMYFLTPYASGKAKIGALKHIIFSSFVDRSSS
ncbi:glycosyl transferase, group 2 family protein [Nonlabens marinus S1-08]|uniref:Glycosyl transferase, group 2 family protein n=2 Tax=Nonlabens TaxID=363408 RepID=W8VZY9_9FLAO|nr:glycosyl transferase, group 2 family protein [Nonlabens marinus S1-08]